MKKRGLAQLLAQADTKLDWNTVLPASLARDLVKDAATEEYRSSCRLATSCSGDAHLLWEYGSVWMLSHTKFQRCYGLQQFWRREEGKAVAISLYCLPFAKCRQTKMSGMQRLRCVFISSITGTGRKAAREGDEPTPPTPRKYLFDVATIQAVVKRSADNGANGALWARDELAGLFNSLGQFSKSGSDEALQILLKLWDGGAIFVDRASMTDSFYAQDSALSITGGIQPNVFRKIF